MKCQLPLRRGPVSKRNSNLENRFACFCTSPGGGRNRKNTEKGLQPKTWPRNKTTALSRTAVSSSCLANQAAHFKTWGHTGLGAGLPAGPLAPLFPYAPFPSLTYLPPVQSLLKTPLTEHPQPASICPVYWSNIRVRHAVLFHLQSTSKERREVVYRKRYRRTRNSAEAEEYKGSHLGRVCRRCSRHVPPPSFLSFLPRHRGRLPLDPSRHAG